MGIQNFVLGGLTLGAAMLGISAFPSASYTQVADAAGPCRLDKVSTANEVSGAGTQTIEVGGSGFQHLDLYPARGARTVSYITERDGRVATYAGYGSIWEGANLDACGRWEQFPWVEDATQYQIGRGRSRGSGLVVNVNLRPEGNLLVVHMNAFNLSQAEVCSVIAEQTPSWRFDNGRPPVWQLGEIGMGSCGGNAAAAPMQSAFSASAPAAPMAANCEPAEKRVRDLGAQTLGQPFRFNDAGGWTIINGWSNEPGQDQAEFTILLSPAENPALLVGGSYYIRPAGCESAARNEFNSSPLPKVTLDQLRSRGLVK